MEEKKLMPEKPMDKETVSQQRSKKMLTDFVQNEVTAFWEGVLDFAEVAISDHQRYKAFRAKVLRMGNNANRLIQREIGRKFLVDFVAVTEDVIEVRPQLPVKRVISTGSGQQIEVGVKK